jgi:hypothetical protein
VLLKFRDAQLSKSPLDSAFHRSVGQWAFCYGWGRTKT